MVISDPIPVSTIARLIQLSIGPVFLLAGVGAILNVLATRLARIVDRVRHLEEAFAGSSSLHQELARSELKRLGTRMKLANWSITLCTASPCACAWSSASCSSGAWSRAASASISPPCSSSPWR
jgi:hypothetical protein